MADRGRVAYAADRRVVRARVGGAASAEYTLATAVVIAALFLPLPGIGASAFDLVLDALGRFHANSTTLLSLP